MCGRFWVKSCHAGQPDHQFRSVQLLAIIIDRVRNGGSIGSGRVDDGHGCIIWLCTQDRDVMPDWRAGAAAVSGYGRVPSYAVPARYNYSATSWYYRCKFGAVLYCIELWLRVIYCVACASPLFHLNLSWAIGMPTPWTPLKNK